MKNKILTGYSILFAGLFACTAPPQDWPDLIRTEFVKKENNPRLILLVPENRLKMDTPPPLIVVPAGGAGFDQYAPLVFLPGNEKNGEQNQLKRVPNDDEGKDTTGLQEGGNANEEAEGEGDNENEGEGNGGTNPLEWPDPKDKEDEDAAAVDAQVEERINRELDEALRRAYGDEEPPPVEEEDPDRIRLRLYTPVVPIPMPDWFNPDIDITPDEPEEPGFDFPLPRWKDLPPDPQRPPYWPGDVPWPPRKYQFPDEWKPLEDGFRYGHWRIYVVPVQAE